MHNETAHGIKRSERFHHALAAGETITGLIIATALVYPDRKLASVKAKSVRKRMKEKAFAAGADRNIILECEQIGIPIEDFCALVITSYSIHYTKLYEPFLVYAESHFAREESAMQRYAFSGYEKHREEHQAFRSHMDSLLKRAERENVDGMALDLLNVMRQWLLNHILVTDKEYASTLQSVDLD